MKGDIIHDGVVFGINNDIIQVKVARSSACASCHAQESCLTQDTEEKIIEVRDPTGQFSVGEKVQVVFQKSGKDFTALF